MTQIMVVEPDDIITTALKKNFLDDDEVKLVFKNDLKEIYELLNGSPTNTDLLEKLNVELDEIKKQFQKAANDEVVAKNSFDNANEILEKYRTNLADLKNPDPKAKNGASELKTPDEIEKQKQELEVEIARFETSITSFRDVLFLETKIKLEKEKLLKEKDTFVEQAKLQVPTHADQVYKVILISSKLLTPSASEWLVEFRKAIYFEANKDIKIVVLGFEFDEKIVKKFLIPGISDYMIKPVDELLGRQNLKFLAIGENKAKREVYSLQINEPVDLIFEYELKGLSDCSFLIDSKENFAINEFNVFDCDLFLRKGQKSVLGKCLSSKESADGRFLSEFWFVGMDTHLSFQIKTVIKNALNK